jgi:hypothetical protein
MLDISRGMKKMLKEWLTKLKLEEEEEYPAYGSTSPNMIMWRMV